ncbi:MAG: hypothetical protein CW346_12455 [Bacillaceae bacterium]|nr:hypothetical protein [Bacillaceae bacterium]
MNLVLVSISASGNSFSENLANVLFAINIAFFDKWRQGEGTEAPSLVNALTNTYQRRGFAYKYGIAQRRKPIPLFAR